MIHYASAFTDRLFTNQSTFTEVRECVSIQTYFKILMLEYGAAQMPILFPALMIVANR
jgi:hypothetical protein